MRRVSRIHDIFHRFYRRRRRFLLPGFFTVLGAFIVYGIFFAPPRLFPVESYIRVQAGQSVADVAHSFKEQSVIRSKTVFQVIAKLYGEEGVIAGDYYFHNPQSALTIVRRLVEGMFDVEPVKITIPEGTSAYGITQMIKERVPDFDAEAFYEIAVQKEGRLFPDTYFISPGAHPEDLVRLMEENFRRKVSQGNVALAVAAFGRSLHDVVVMASLLEKEANNSLDRRMIAGILWNRMKNDMPLQVDAVFPYFTDKNTFTITRAEMQVDNPYNTYVHKGLPPGAITNPGLDAIMDAVTPIATDYVYYLSDWDGRMYYSVTYEQHLQNKAKYIDS